MSLVAECSVRHFYESLTDVYPHAIFHLAGPAWLRGNTLACHVAGSLIEIWPHQR